MTSSDPPIFLLSPANLNGVRGTRLLEEKACSELAARLRSVDGATIGEIYTHISTLYFRGKLAYGLHFGGEAATRVVVPGYGLELPSWQVDLSRAREICACPVDPQNAGYREPFARDVEALAASSDGPVVFLGSLATRKYLDVLVPILGKRLHHPVDFLGCGEMRRGSLLLRAVDADAELEMTVWREPSRC